MCVCVCVIHPLCCMSWETPSHSPYRTFSFFGISCLASSFFYTTHCQYAKELLCTFVQDFGRIYCADMLVYNVHGLSYLAGDVANFGPLDRFAAFPFENVFVKLKVKLRKPNFPVKCV